MIDPRIKEWLQDHKDGSFLLCQAMRAGVWQWFCKMSTNNWTGLRYDGTPDMAIEHVLNQWDEAVKGRAA